MTSFFLAIGAILSFYQVGVLVDYYVFSSRKVDKMIPVYFGLGLGSITLFQLILSLLEISLSPPIQHLILALLYAPFIVDSLLRKKLVASLKQVRKQKSTMILFSLLTLVLSLFVFSQLIWGSDAYSFWLSKGNAFFIDSGITLKNLFLYWPYDHPLLWPLTATWFYQTLGEANEYWFQIIPLSIYLNVIMYFYISIKRKTSYPFLFTGILILTPFFLDQIINPDYMGNADLLVSFFVLLTVGSWFSKQYHFMLLFSFFGMLTKNDVVPLFFTVFLLLILWMKIKNKFSKNFSWLLIMGGLASGYWILRQEFRLSNRYLSEIVTGKNSFSFFLDRLIYILHAFREELRQTQKWGLGWGLIIITFIATIKDLRYNRLTLAWLILGIQLVAYIGIYLITPEDLATHITTSLSRLLLQMFPSLLLISALAWNKYKKGT